MYDLSRETTSRFSQFLFSSVTVCRAVSNLALSEMNEENLLCPAGQRLVQKSGSQLNPPPTTCHRHPAPSHSAQGVGGDPRTARSHCQKSALAREGCSEKQTPKKTTSQWPQTRRSAPSGPIRNKYVTLLAAASIWVAEHSKKRGGLSVWILFHFQQVFFSTFTCFLHIVEGMLAATSDSNVINSVPSNCISA